MLDAKKVTLAQWFPTLGPHMFLDYFSQESWPAQLVVKASGSFGPKTPGNPRLGAIALAGFKWLEETACQVASPKDSS